MSHPIGHHWTDGAKAYVNIPRCASASIKTSITDAGWYEATGPIAPGMPAMAVIRHPYDRYWSGVREFEARHGRSADRSIVRVWDEHTMPQYVFLMPFGDVTLFAMDDMAAAGDWLGVSIDRRLHVSPDEPNPYDRAAVQRFYAEDMRLYYGLRVSA